MLHQLIILLSFLIVLPWLESLDGTKHKDYLVKARLRESEDSSRINVFDSLDASSGIFKDRQKVEELRLENTLLITVAAFNIVGNGHYKKYLHNIICFFKHYGMRAVVYILHHNVEDFSSLKEEMEEHDIQLMSYPDVLFWELVNNKTQPIRKGKNFATYDGQFPSFREYGALVMLVPAFEALQLGFNVVYLDIDIGLVQNPIPYLVRGDAE